MLGEQVVDGVTTRFVNSGGLVLQERDASNNVTRAYVWDGVSPGGIGGLLEMTLGGAHYNYLFDGKGNVSALIDENQDVVVSYKYDPFGVLVSQTGTLDQPYRFSTKRYYPTFGIVKYQRRDYLPALGRWAERDPIGEAGGLNLYGFVDSVGKPTGVQTNLYNFVGNNPVNAIDPLGLWAMGGSIEFSTINPFTSGGGGSYGLNLEYTSGGGLHLYYFYTPNNVNSSGLLLGPSAQVNFATGCGDWTGPFDNGAGSFGPVTGGFFQTPLDNADLGYFGFSLGGALGPPGIGFTRTEYQKWY